MGKKTASSKKGNEYAQQPEVAKTQADLMPPASEVDLDDLPNPLEEMKYFEEWLAAVERVLKSKNLYCLIDGTTPRPSSNHPRRCEWQTISEWFSTTIADRLDGFNNKIYNCCSQYYADEYIAAAKHEARNPLDDFRRFQTLHDTRLGSFIRTVQYVEAYQLRIHHIHRTGLPINWYYHAGLMILQLQDSSHWMDQLISNTVMNLFMAPDAREKHIREHFSAEDFSKLCSFIQAQLWKNHGHAP